MTDPRYVVLGLARARAEWFRLLAQRATAGSLPVDFVKCLTVEELEARIEGAGGYSAVIVDGGVAGVDRDLVDRAHARTTAVFVVRGATGDQHDIGADAVLDPAFDDRQLLEALRARATAVARAEPPAPAAPDAPRGMILAVCGPGGTGASTVALAAAQGLARLPHRSVVLVDGARRADQAAFHDVDDGGSGLLTLVDLHRDGPLDWPALAPHLYVAPHGHHLLTGLRRPSAWPAVRSQPLHATFGTLARYFSWVVVDTDADVEGEQECGSVDVEDRHVLSRTSLALADRVVLVVAPGLKGTLSTLRALRELESFGVFPDRVTVVVNRSPRRRRPAREMTDAVRDLHPAHVEPAFVCLPERPVDDAVRDGRPLPAALVDPLVRHLSAVPPHEAGIVDEPRPLAPGELGRWLDDEPEVLSG